MSEFPEMDSQLSGTAKAQYELNKAAMQWAEMAIRVPVDILYAKARRDGCIFSPGMYALKMKAASIEYLLKLQPRKLSRKNQIRRKYVH